MNTLDLGVELRLTPRLVVFVGLEDTRLLRKEVNIGKARFVVGIRHIVTLTASRLNRRRPPDVGVDFAAKLRGSLTLAALRHGFAHGLRVNARFAEEGVPSRCLLEAHSSDEFVVDETGARHQVRCDPFGDEVDQY